MYFLGQAANYRARDILRHTFAFGTQADADHLRQHLAQRYLGAADRAALRRTVLYGTGRSALAAAIKATTPRGSTVCATALTCYAVVQAIAAADCQPVFADVDPRTLHFGAKELTAALKKHPEIHTIIVQNNLGHPADISAIEKVARQHHLTIIEDLAHSAGIRYADGREAGTVGAATILSFGKGKSVDTIAGGALILRDSTLKAPPRPTRRPRLSNSLRARWYPFFGACIRGLYHVKLGRYLTSLLLKLHFIERSADAPLSLQTRCTHWQARLALRQLANLPASRPPLRDFYLVDHREQVLTELEHAGYIFNDTWYDCPVAPERYFSQSHFSAAECPVATAVAAQLINLPRHYPAADLAPARKIIQRHALARPAQEANHD